MPRLFRLFRRPDAPLIVMTFDEFAALNEEPAPNDEPEHDEPEFQPSRGLPPLPRTLEPTTQRFHPFEPRGPLYTDPRYVTAIGDYR